MSATPSRPNVQLRVAVWVAVAVASAVAVAVFAYAGDPGPAAAAALCATCAVVLALVDARVRWRRLAPATVWRAVRVMLRANVWIFSGASVVWSAAGRPGLAALHLAAAAAFFAASKLLNRHHGTLVTEPAPPGRCVQVEPVGASLHSTEYAARPELAVWSDRESGRTWLAVRFARVLVEVELEPGQVDTVTAGLLDEVPVPYELVDLDLDAELAELARVPSGQLAADDPATWRGWW